MYTTKFFPFQIPYLSIILVEPELIDRDTFNKTVAEQGDRVDRLQKITTGRRNAWPTKNDAFEYFSKRAPWNTWDARVLHIYVVC
jgi:hypothetical protein